MMEFCGLVRPKLMRGTELFTSLSEFIGGVINGDRGYRIVGDDILNRLWLFDKGGVT